MGPLVGKTIDALPAYYASLVGCVFLIIFSMPDSVINSAHVDGPRYLLSCQLCSIAGIVRLAIDPNSPPNVTLSCGLGGGCLVVLCRLGRNPSLRVSAI